MKNKLLLLLLSLSLPLISQAQNFSVQQINNVLKENQAASAPLMEELPSLEDIHTPIAKKILSQSNSIVKVQVQNKTGKEKTSVGSGSIITPDGLIVTNYHVISSHFLDPATTHIVFNIGKDSVDHEAQLEAVDLVDDLAFIRPLEPLKAKPIILDNKELPVGERVYSVGFPHNWSMTMIDGFYNGYMLKELIPHYLVSHSLSSGMSGGPTFGENGKLVAVNVAATNKLSILIPVASVFRFLQDYSQEQASLAKASGYNEKIKLIRQMALNRYDKFSDTLLQHVLASDNVSIGKFSLPLSNPLYECWSKQSQGSDMTSLDHINIFSKEKLIQTQRNCSTQDTVFLQEDNDIAQITMNAYHYEQPNIKANSLILWKTIEKKFNLISFQNELIAKSMEGTCFYKDVTNQRGKLQKIQICISPLRETSKLWHLQIQQIFFDENSQGLILNSAFDGFSEKNINIILNYMKKI